MEGQGRPQIRQQNTHRRCKAGRQRENCTVGVSVSGLSRVRRTMVTSVLIYAF